MKVSRLVKNAIAASVVLGCVWPTLVAAQVHKVIGPDGKVTYSDRAPAADPGAKTSTISAPVARAALTDGPPKLKRGLWEFQRTLEINGKSQQFTTRNCTDPIATMSFWQKTMGKVGCTYEDTRRTGNRYTQASACKIDSVAMDRRYAKSLEVSSDEAYVLQESASGGPQPPMSSTTRARRVGDC